MRPPILLAALLLLAAACASTGSEQPTAGTRLCVTNSTVAYGTLRVYAGSTAYRVEPGQRACKGVRGQGVVRLRGSTIGGGIMGPVRVRDHLTLDEGCWELEVMSVGPSFPVPCRGAR